MNDRERVLMNIAVDVTGSSWDTFEPIQGGWKIRLTFGRPAEQFMDPKAAEKIGMPMKPGDIVRCRTNPNHAWGISELVEQIERDTFMLRLIGGDSLMRMSNESVEVLRFMAPSRLYTGTKHKLYGWASNKAFSTRYNPHADYFKRCGGVEFEGDTLVVWSRPHIWAMEKRQENGPTLHAQPKRFTLKWDHKTRLKDIINAMIEQGFAEDYEFTTEEPDKGMGGCAKITKDDLVSAMSHHGLAARS